MLKFVLFLQLIIIPSISSANSSVGNFRIINNPEKLLAGKVFIKDISQIKNDLNVKIVYAIGNKDGIAEFATGRAVNGAWDIQRYAVPSRVLENSEFSQFIEQSNSSKEWVELK